MLARHSPTHRRYVKTLLARWMRILPAFSVGGVVNVELLDRTRKWLGVVPLAH